MKIVHISKAEYREHGGASRAANRLHRGLRAIGQDSWMFVARRELNDPNVIAFQRPRGLAAYLTRTARFAHLRSDSKRIEFAVRTGLSEYFSDDRSEHGANPLVQLPDADIFNLHWVSDFVDYRRFLPVASRRAPLVWTLHDMIPFTGGCFSTEGCDRFTSQCGGCPQLGSSSESDLSRRTWKRKRSAYQRIPPGRLHVVAPSRWLAAEAARSSLLRDVPITVIPHGLDAKVFSPKGRSFARQVLDLPQDKKIILWAAWAKAGGGRRLKGGELFVQSLQGLADQRDLLVVSVGAENRLADLGIPHISLGLIADERLMALAYSAADIYVTSSLQESFGYTILESMACGVPVVAFNVTGIPDLVRDGVTGTLALSSDAAGLRAAILHTFADPARLAWMGANCRRIAVQEYSSEIYARRYTALYEEVLAVNRASEKNAGHATSEFATVR